MTPTKSMHRPGKGAGQYEWKDYSTTTRPPGQWDAVDGTLEGHWSTPMAARAALAGKFVTLPGVAAGYGFYVSGGDLRTYYGPNGRVRADVQTAGLFAEKLRKLKFTQREAYSVQNVPVSGLTGLPNGTYGKFQFSPSKPGYKVLIAWAQTPGRNINLASAGKPITAHWAATAAGISLALDPGTNPFIGSDPDDFTWHWPAGWTWDVNPVDTLGDETGGLAIAEFTFTHQWPKTL